jgi:hypothetical protein
MTDKAEDSIATAKARLSIRTVKALNSGSKFAMVEAYADDIAVLLAAHSDLDRAATAADVRYAALHAAAHAYFHAATNRKATLAAPALRAILKETDR